MPPLSRTDADRDPGGPEYAGEYRLQAVLGAGGMGVVHLASSPSGLRLAVKVVHARYAEDPDFRARFRQEVAAARRVSGAFTAPVVDADPDAERPWMATLYVPGPTLADQVRQRGPLSPAELRRLTAGLAEALRDIHRAGVVHRDLKPSNVLLTDTGPKVIDFGISRPVDSDLRTETGKLIGSPPFMAPEQFQRPREVGPAADVFALGSVLVHAATGHGPFDSDSPYIVAYQVVHDEPDLSGVPGELAPLVARCLAKEPGDRPTPAQIMAALLPPSYEAEAFIPTQRRRPVLPADPFAPDGRPYAPDGQPYGADDALAAQGGSGATMTRAAVPAPPARRRRGPRAPRLTVSAAVVLVLAGAGVYAALRPPARPATEAPAHPAEVATAFDGWHTRLQEHGGTAAPACLHEAGSLYCTARGVALARLDPRTGEVLWKRTGPVAADPPLAPVPLAGGTEPLVGVATGTGPLRAHAVEDGAPGWTARADVAETFRPAGGVVVLTDGHGALRGIDARTGAGRWSHRLTGFDNPVLGAYDAPTGLLTVSETAGDGRSSRIGAVLPATGELVWSRVVPGDAAPVGRTGDGTLVLASRYQGSLVDALVLLAPGDPDAPGSGPDAGSVRRVGIQERMLLAGVAVRGSVAYLLSLDGRLVALDTAPEKGSRRWELETGASNVSAPVLGPDERLYLSAADGRLFAVDTARGAVVGQTRPRLENGRLGYAPQVPAPLVAGERVFGTAPDGSVFAVHARVAESW
ncbi:PQQ-binding-like beta-propeller repeat protein [Streptomyces sp. R302]|uniref:serine/threonine-protein kinase n=1 Tax=unclassified Streptomyces TaxID=2593676 RepID=UPI00145D2F64|nr:MULTISPECIES: serine/threonine-protein kinase [unclassified Streptomyces]NML52054.1 PQQ-binding-like beta-propeller repeat protein [Streptomyces sp. R301]NML82480.1 PQQ-binding-like beta-propeller repeat protein [Streptomyces sp. R302]